MHLLQAFAQILKSRGEAFTPLARATFWLSQRLVTRDIALEWVSKERPLRSDPVQSLLNDHILFFEK